jgi:2-polyprenyl-6-hydroxyphenyl methylase/3-demethylubiquinone-9 3-methyltransferase
MNHVNTDEISKFENMAEQWWDESGPLKPLHKLNPTRIHYIRHQIYEHFDRDTIDGLNILDVGCGGGLACEPLCRLGAKVTGIDAGEKAIAVAKAHADESGLEIDYHCQTSHEHKGQYDVILALEIIEHLDDIPAFIASLTKLLKKDGLIIFSTLNRTAKSFVLGIIGAEYIMRWLPKGTHNWKKFVKPSELAGYAEDYSLKVKDITGLVYNPLIDVFSLSDSDIDVNYFMSATRNLEKQASK